MKIGYARVSTPEQKMDLQIDELKAAGCKKIFSEVVTGAKADRAELNKMLEQARPGDIIVIWKLDRLGRSLKHLVELVGDLIERDIGLKSLHDPIDTSTSQGRLIFNIFASLAEFEREVISERTRAGLSAARARGRVGGRPKGLSRKARDKARVIAALYKEGKMSIAEILENQQVSRATLYNYLRHEKVELGDYNGDGRQ
jgi:DNA invertase Pin-like site-specific DNA recombinase